MRISLALFVGLTLAAVSEASSGASNGARVSIVPLLQEI